ncbi:MAG: hypothetical protein QJT81_07550 [Candidatus Thiothrix putei]|uniref:Uncharacterized protein n=1 Tax=Candidatus Thiothrix putei TaxID=3080811 RepID=A0AA95HGM5_9GAMM|nr:MAG: hypothetical protein QJT81_07550 [Candidatus Thiothrix putei]
MKPMIKYLTATVLLSLTMSYPAHAASIRCKDISSSSERLKDTLSQFRYLGWGIFSETIESKIYKYIKDKNDDVADLSGFCAALQGHDELEAYFIALDRLSSLAGPAGGYINEQVKAGRFIIARAKDIAEEKGLQVLQFDYGLMGFSINIDKDSGHWFWPNSSLKPNEMRKLIEKVSLVHSGNTTGFELMDAGVFLHRPGYEMRSDGEVYSSMTGEALSDEKVLSFNKTYEPYQKSVGYITGGSYTNPSSGVVY